MAQGTGPAIQDPGPGARCRKLSISSVRFSLPSAGWVAVHVSDVAGRHVRTLADGAHSDGTHTLVWDSLGDGRTPAPPGVYFVRDKRQGTWDVGRTRKVVIAR